jgi:agmatine deiminase
MNNNLSLIGYRMPAEWELQESVWIAWPYNKSDWPGLFKNIPKIVTQIISELSRSQKISLLINNYNDKKKIINLLSKFPNNLQNIIFYKITTNRIWLRDSGPIYIINEKTKKKLIVNFKFNAWSKYKDYKKDNNINNKLSKLTKVKKIDPVVEINNKSKQLVLEGGAIDVNGKGSVLLTKECLLSKVQERNPGITKKSLEKTLSKYLNVKNFIWLNKGIKGDDTHGHIDDISRFVSEDVIMTAVEKK